MSPRELPIYELEDRLIASVREQGRLIVQAPTGSGKSTQVPQMLLNHGLLGQGEVVVLQPRRLAARMLAKRVAEEVGTALGDVVGYLLQLIMLLVFVPTMMASIYIAYREIFEATPPPENNKAEQGEDA